MTAMLLKMTSLDNIKKESRFVPLHSGAKLHAVLLIAKILKLGFEKKSKVPSLRCKKVCHKWK